MTQFFGSRWQTECKARPQKKKTIMLLFTKPKIQPKIRQLFFFAAKKFWYFDLTKMKRRLLTSLLRSSFCMCRNKKKVCDGVKKEPKKIFFCLCATVGNGPCVIGARQPNKNENKFYFERKHFE